MNKQTTHEQVLDAVLTDDELGQVVGGGDDDIKGDITINPKRS